MTEVWPPQGGITRPSSTSTRGKRPLKYPLDELEVGEFLFFPGGNSRSLSVYASRAGKRLGCTFSVKEGTASRSSDGESWDFDENGVQGVSILKVSDTPRPPRKKRAAKKK